MKTFFNLFFLTFTFLHASDNDFDLQDPEFSFTSLKMDPTGNILSKTVIDSSGESTTNYTTSPSPAPFEDTDFRFHQETTGLPKGKIAIVILVLAITVVLVANFLRRRRKKKRKQYEVYENERTRRVK